MVCRITILCHHIRLRHDSQAILYPTGVYLTQPHHGRQPQYPPHRPPDSTAPVGADYDRPSLLAHSENKNRTANAR